MSTAVPQAKYRPSCMDRFNLKRPRRINVTVPEALLEELQQTADGEGRSLSSLCCHLMESALERRAELKQRRH